MSSPRKKQAQRIGLVLGGGGARAAYQVGVLRTIASMMPEGARNPFPIVCGSSAGSINATILAAYASRFHEGVQRLVGVWENFSVQTVFRTDLRSAVVRGGRWIGAMSLGGLGKYSPESLLDNTPLRELVERHVPFARLDQAINSGDLHALALTACSYSSGRSVTFFQGQKDLGPWHRTRRIGQPESIELDHLMASAAIPIIFPAIRIGGEYFGDGSMRQFAPISPALHLGADKVLVIGVRHEQPDFASNSSDQEYPGVGQIAGYILDTLFLNNLYSDLERLERINETLRYVSNRRITKGDVPLRPIQTLVISPSQDIAAIAERHYHRFPKTVKYLLGVIGARGHSGRRLMSYLLFEKEFCREVMQLGSDDARRQEQAIRRFLLEQRKN